MLTKQDLQEIGKLIEPLKDKILDLEDDLKDHKSDITSSNLRLRIEIKEEFDKNKRRIREFKEEFDEFVDHFDEYLQKTRREVAQIKSHLKLPPLS